MSNINRFTATQLVDTARHIAYIMRDLGHPHGSESQRMLRAASDRVIDLCKTPDVWSISQRELQREMRSLVIAFQRVEADLADCISGYLEQVAEDC